MIGRSRRALLALLIAGLSGLAPTRAQGPDPWAALRAVRESLAAAGPQQANFTQTFVPAGFKTGESETGQLSMALPDCLRWDYREPYPKSFLLCGGSAWAWNPKDKTGRRSAVDRKTEPGLDLLLLGIETLKERYKAAARNGAEGRIEISLAPIGRTKSVPIKDAVLTVDPAADRIVEVSYRDGDGNLTRFELTGYRDLARRGTTFSPPAGISWSDR